MLDYPWPIVLFGIAGAIAVIAMHRQNIRRLAAGTEHRFELRRELSVTDRYKGTLDRSPPRGAL